MRSLALILGLWLAGPVFAQTPAAKPAPVPCTGPEFRTLDFWVGDWIAEDQQGKRIGTNRITRDEYGGCVIAEHFRMDDATMKGHSVSTYRPGLKQWRQNWVDDQGGYFDLVGGPVTGADHIFVFENKRVAETQPHQRMICRTSSPTALSGAGSEDQGRKAVGRQLGDPLLTHEKLDSAVIGLAASSSLASPPRSRPKLLGGGEPPVDLSANRALSVRDVAEQRRERLVDRRRIASMTSSEKAAKLSRTPSGPGPCRVQSAIVMQAVRISAAWPRAGCSVVRGRITMCNPQGLNAGS